MPIRLLPDSLIDRIAAGEVVERPASVAKELIENSLDAGAQRISITTAEGGKTLLRIEDDGCGMNREDLHLSIRRHATSKLASDDLTHISTMGFRGEALAAISSVSRFIIRSRPANNEGLELEVDFGVPGSIKPVAMNRGTVMEMRSLFARVPARLKFLKSDRSEAAAITDTVRELALANPSVHFLIQGNDRSTINWPGVSGPEALRDRIGQVLGRELIDNAIPLNTERHGIQIKGFACTPAYTRANSMGQHYFVNGRVVRDKQLLGAVRAAYSDFVFRDRHPVVVLFVEMSPGDLDVNVHPAKTEVRFRDVGALRSAVIVAIKSALQNAGHTGASHTDKDLATTLASSVHMKAMPASWPELVVPSKNKSYPSQYDEPTPTIDGLASPSARMEEVVHDSVISNHPLGAARAQLFENYIVAQSDEGLILVDQHAAHERLVYERFKARLAEGNVPSQASLIPAVVELTEDECDILEEAAPQLERFGLMLGRFGPKSVAVHGTPSILGNPAVEPLLKDLVDGLIESGSTAALTDRMEAVIASMACHGSVRSGRILRVDEMNALLREMETTPHSMTCIHGRPTVCSITITDLERLFGRSK